MSKYITNSDIIIISGSSVIIGKDTANAQLDISGSGIVSGSFTVTQGITGSLYGTASWADNSISASYAFNSTSASYAATSSYSTETSNVVIYVKNQSGYNINKGVVVRITGSNNSSDIPRIVTASYENDNNSANTLGITDQAIADGSDGYVITEGILLGINTSNFTSGQLIYLGATGSITGSAPMAPLHAVRLGEVIRQQSNNGSIYVRIDNGYELDELHNVVIVSQSSGDLLVASGSVWYNTKQLTGSYGLTGSLQATSFTGSLQGTSSWASNVLTSSFALTASYVANASSFPYTGSAVITGSLVVTGSVSSTAGFTGSLFGTASLAQTASNAILLQTLTSNATVGGSTSGTVYSAGSSIETVLRAILITYIAPTLGSFSLYNGGSLVLSSSPTAEVSSSYTFNTASFTATADNPNGRYAYSASFTASGASVGNFTYFFGNNVLGTSNNLGLGGTQTINNTANGTVTFTLNGVNPQTSATISQTRTITYVYPYYYGMSATDYSTTGNVSASLTQLVQSQGTKTLSINGTSAYVYFCYPASYADLTSIKDGNNFEVLSSFTKYTRTQDGAPGKWAGVSYKIYRSNTLTNVSPAQNYIFT